MDEFDDRTTTLPGPPGTSNGNGNGSKVVPFPEKKKRRFGRRRRTKKIRIRKFRVDDFHSSSSRQCFCMTKEKLNVIRHSVS